MSEVTMRDLLEAGVHFGHQRARWNPKMAKYIYGVRDGVHIINLGKTIRLFRDAVHFASRIVADGGQILFIGTKRQAQEVIIEEATRCRMPYITNRWLGGMLTNFKTIKQSLDRLNDIEKLLGEGSVEKLTKKEIVVLERERDKLVKNLGGIREMNEIPAAVFIVDPAREEIAVQEAARLGIPIIAICDTNCNPDRINSPIPGNDDAIRAVRLFTAAIADTVLATRTATPAALAQELTAGAVMEQGDGPVVQVRRSKRAEAEEAPAAEA